MESKNIKNKKRIKLVSFLVFVVVATSFAIYISSIGKENLENLNNQEIQYVQKINSEYKDLYKRDEKIQKLNLLKDKLKELKKDDGKYFRTIKEIEHTILFMKQDLSEEYYIKYNDILNENKDQNQETEMKLIDNFDLSQLELSLEKSNKLLEMLRYEKDYEILSNDKYIDFEKKINHKIELLNNKIKSIKEEKEKTKENKEKEENNSKNVENNTAQNTNSQNNIVSQYEQPQTSDPVYQPKLSGPEVAPVQPQPVQPSNPVPVNPPANNGGNHGGVSWSWTNDNGYTTYHNNDGTITDSNGKTVDHGGWLQPIGQ